MRTAILLLASLLVFSNAHAKKVKTFDPPKEMYSLAQLDTSTIQSLIYEKHKDVTIVCEEGEELPLHFLYRFDLFSAKLDPCLTVKVEKACYLRFVKGKAYISTDLVSWEKASRFLDGKPDIDIKKKMSDVFFELKFTPLSDKYSD